MSFLHDLNPVQTEAVRTIDGPVMIIAGAGSGKTRVLTYRIAHLIHSGVRPDSILALTFTNKAANEMKSRIDTLLSIPSRGLMMGTFHSIFARLLRFECHAIGYTRSFTIYDSEDSLSLVRQCMQTLGISQQQYHPNAIRSRISASKNHHISVSAFAGSAHDPMAERTARVYELYEKQLKNSNAFDFDDLLLKPLELFSRHPDILKKYQQAFTHVLVDEYQDTNRVQYDLIRKVGHLRKNICVVGDDAQSIYAFRGADIRNILDFEQDYPNCQVFRLEQNYRSTKTILSAADSVIRQNQDQLKKSLWTENPAGDPIVVSVCSDDREEGRRVFYGIQEEMKRRELDLKDFAVLYRTNAQSRAIEDALRRNGVPYVIVGGVAFYKRKEIKDILAYLRLIVNPRDEESLLRIINVPARSIGDVSIRKLKRRASERGSTLYEALPEAKEAGVNQERTVAALRQLHGMIGKYLRLRSEMSVSELTRALVDELGVLRTLKEENTVESLARRENIQELISALTEFNESGAEATLERFLEEVALVSDVDTTEFGRNAVVLMTLHAAKGLEFPVVFITGLEEGLFPLLNASQDRKEMEEERRLMYVGITRAKEQLYLLYTLTRYRFGELTYSVKSRFLEEIDPSLVRLEDHSARSGSSPYRRATPRTSSAISTRQHIPSGDDHVSDPMPSYEEESQESVTARIGSRVVHASFGKGRIVAIDGIGDNTRAVVDFDLFGRKNLMLKFAHLRSA